MHQAMYRIVTAVLFVTLAGSGGAVAQTLSAPSPTNNSSPNELNLSGTGTSWDRQSQVTTLSTGSTSFQMRYASSVSCDSGAFGSARTESMSSDYSIAFSVTAPAAYYLDIDTRRTGDLSARYDGGITGGNATMGAVTGVQTGGSYVSGSLNLPDPTDCNIGGATTSSCNQPYNQLATARYTAVSNGVPVNHTLQFTWSQSTFSAAASGHEGAVRMGMQSRDSTNEASMYPGSPSRANQANDGHFVTVTLVSLCGNGTIDSGEVCDQGAANGTPQSCCTAACQLRASGLFCRLPMGDCDAAEMCDGVGPNCPPDGYSPGSQTCRGAAGGCDIAEFCTGFGPDCPADQLAAPTTVCRAASSGEVCDVSEFCDGATPNCPADAVEPSGTLCRSSDGICDLVETCNGTDKLCPTDAKSTALCRASAGICDSAESCDGVGNNCPADAFQPASVTCRASAGICDLAEQCSGSGAACPGDAKSTAVCRAAAGGCDVAESCTGSGDSCPADQLLTSGTVCRGASGVCDVSETCTGAAAACPSNVSAPSGTSCSDGQFCNGAEVCNGSGVCTDSVDPCPFICSEGLDQCLMSGCPSGPIGGCRTAQKSLLLIKNNVDDSRDKLIWKWIKGQASLPSDFEDPRSTANYAFCVYAGPGAALRMQVDVPPSATLWSTLGSSGFKYYDFSATQDGAQRVILKGSTVNKTKIQVRGAGVNLEDPLDTSNLAMPVRVQLVNHQTGKCFESTFSAFKRNTTAQFKAKN